MSFQYQPGESLFHRLDPLTKFVWLLCVSIVAIGFDKAAIHIALLALIVLIGTTLAHLKLRKQFRAMRLPIAFGIPYFVLQLFLLPGTTPLVKTGSLVLTVEALDVAAAVSLRLLTLVLASLLFIATTDPRDVVLAVAQKLRVPYRFAFAVSIALRFLPLLEAEAALIRSASRLRGLEPPKGVRPRIRAALRFAAAVFVSAISRVQSIAAAMDAKAFGASNSRTYLRTVSIRAGGLALATSSIVATAFAFAWL